MEMSQADPTLAQQFLAKPDPWGWAYDHVSKHEEYEEVKSGDFADKERARIRDELKAELLAEMQGTSEAKEKLEEAITPSLAGKASAAGGTTTVTDESLEGIFKS